MTKSMPSYSRNTLFPVLVRSNKNINSGIIPAVSHSALVNLDFLISPTHTHIYTDTHEGCSESHLLKLNQCAPSLSSSVRFLSYFWHCLPSFPQNISRARFTKVLRLVFVIIFREYRTTTEYCRTLNISLAPTAQSEQYQAERDLGNVSFKSCPD